MGLDQKDSGGFIGSGRPGGPGGNKVAGDLGGDAIRKARPKSELGAGQSTGSKGGDNNPIRKSRPKSSGSGQTTNTK